MSLRELKCLCHEFLGAFIIVFKITKSKEQNLLLNTSFNFLF